MQKRRNWKRLENFKVSSQLVLKSQYLARIGGPDILWSVITKSTRACDKRMARLTSCNHNTSDDRQHCHVGNTALWMVLLQYSDFVGDLDDSKSTQGERRGILCIFGSRTLAPIYWTGKKQTSASHSSAESEVVSVDAGLRMDGIPALDLGYGC